MKNTTLFFVFAVLILIAGGFFFLKGDKSINGKAIDSESGDTQKITLSMKNYNYYPNTIRVKADQPVEITLDSSIGGCYRSFTIRDFGVAKYSKTPEDKITFTPTKKGSFRFACSMGMGTGTIIVE